MLVWVLALLVAVLALTGVYLVFAYRPAASQAWPQLAPADRSTGGPELARTIHRWAAILAVAVAAVTAVLVVVEAAVRWHGPRRRRGGVLTGPAIALVVVGGLITGLLLPWDQLALRAVTVGTNLDGYGAILWGDQVRFVLIDGREVSVGDLRMLLVVHALVLPVVLAALLAHAHRDRPAAQQPPAEAR